MLYQISYDLRQPGRTYSRLHRALQTLGARRILESQWLLVSRHSAADLWEHLVPLVDVNDALLVQELALDSAWGTASLLIRDSEMRSILKFARRRAA